MSPDDFTRLLESLSPDRDEACRCYNRLQEKIAGFFRMKGLSDPEGAAGEVLDRAAVRISGGANVPDVAKYCFGIARNVAREKWRREQRESSIFLLFIQSLTNNSAEEVERIQQILKPCFEELPEEDQKLLLGYCQVPQGLSPAEHRSQLAETLKITRLALRLRVMRLRSSLADSVRRRAENS